MAIVRKLLETSPTLENIELSLRVIDYELLSLIDSLKEDIDFQNKLIGVSLDKIFTNNLSNLILFQGGTYTINPGYNITINAKNITSDDEGILTHSDILSLLKDYVTLDNVFDNPVDKAIVKTNVVSVNDLYAQSNVHQNGTIIKAEECLTDMEGLIADNSFINYEYLLNEFYTTQSSSSFLSLTINNKGKSDISAFDTMVFNNCKFNEVLLNYTLEEIEGVGAKLSDFNEVQKAVAPISGIYTVMVNVLWPAENSLTINGQTSTYTPDPANDTLDIVADTLASGIDIDGLSYELDDGYYYGTPKDADGEYKLAWYAKDTAENKTYHVTVNEDNNSEHDLEINWDSDNGKLTITYASDGSDPLYPTIGEFVNDVNNYDCPIKVIFVDTANYTTDDDYSMHPDFDLDQTTSLIKFTSDKTALNISGTPNGLFGINTVQEFVAGKHQNGDISCIRFERGHKFFIKVDNTEIDIDLTDSTTDPDITDCNSLIAKFNDLLSSSNIPFVTTYTDKTISLLGKDYSEHTITTSGATDNYSPPLPRNVTVLNDIKDMVRQNGKTILYKNGDTYLTQVNLLTPVCFSDIEFYYNEGFFANDSNIINLKINEDSYHSDNNLARMSDVYDKIESLLAINNFVFPTKELKYITNYDIVIDVTLSSTEKMQLQEWGLLSIPENKFIDKKQIGYFNQTTLKDMQLNLLGLDDIYFTKLLNNASRYLNMKTIVSYEDIKTTSNNITKNGIALIERDMSKVLSPIFPVIDFNKVDNNILKFIDPTYTDYESLKFDFSNNALKHTLFGLTLAQQSPNTLAQLSYLISKFNFSADDVLMHIDNDYLRDTVLELNTQDNPPQPNYGLDGQKEDGSITFSDFYIREYKNNINNENSSTTAASYLLLDVDSLSLPDKLLLTIPYKTKENILLNFTIDKDTSYNLQSLIHSVLDDLIYQHIVKSGYFMSDGWLKGKIGSGLTRYNDTVWALLLRTFYFVDEDTIVGVKDSLGILRILYSKFTSINAWELALFLSPATNEISIDNISPNSVIHINKIGDSGLWALYFRIWEYIDRNNISQDKYQDTFNKLTGLLFKNDNTATGILPYETFEVFLSIIGIKNYSSPLEKSILDKIIKHNSTDVLSLEFKDKYYYFSLVSSSSGSASGSGSGSSSG